MNHSKLNPPLVAGLLLIMAVGCASFGPAGSAPPTAAPPTDPNDNPTAGAIARSTRQAQATLDARATQSRIASQTAMAQAAMASQTAVAQAAVAATAAHTWAVREQETFTMANPSRWPEGSRQSKYLAFDAASMVSVYSWAVNPVANAVLDGSAYFIATPPNSPILGDFYATVNVKLYFPSDYGYAYGLAFRIKGQDFGFFGLNGDGSYLLLETHQSSVAQTMHGTALTMKTPSTTIVNQIAVVGKGTDFIALVNNAPVAEFNATLGPGQIGLGVQSAAQPTHIDASSADFTDFVVRAP